MKPAIPNLEINEGVECLARMSAAWRIFAPRQLPSHMDAINAEVFFYRGSLRAPSVGALATRRP